MLLELSREEVLAVYAQGPEAVVALVATLVARVNALEARVAALEAAQAKDSHNSGMPPSTDVTRAGRAPKSLRGRSGKRPGGQPGHPGRTLVLRAAPDVVHDHAPGACHACGAAFAADAPCTPVRGERRQVFECRRSASCARSTASPSARARGAAPSAVARTRPRRGAPRSMGPACWRWASISQRSSCCRCSAQPTSSPP